MGGLALSSLPKPAALRAELRRPHAAIRCSRQRCSVVRASIGAEQIVDSEGKKVEKRSMEQQQHAATETPAPAQMANGSQKTVLDSTDLEGDAVLEKELSDNGEQGPFLSCHQLMQFALDRLHGAGADSATHKIELLARPSCAHALLFVES